MRRRKKLRESVSTAIKSLRSPEIVNVLEKLPSEFGDMET